MEDFQALHLGLVGLVDQITVNVMYYVSNFDCPRKRTAWMTPIGTAPQRGLRFCPFKALHPDAAAKPSASRAVLRPLPPREGSEFTHSRCYRVTQQVRLNGFRLLHHAGVVSRPSLTGSQDNVLGPDSQWDPEVVRRARDAQPHLIIAALQVAADELLRATLLLSPRARSNGRALLSIKTIELAWDVPTIDRPSARRQRRANVAKIMGISFAGERQRAARDEADVELVAYDKENGGGNSEDGRTEQYVVRIEQRYSQYRNSETGAPIRQIEKRVLPRLRRQKRAGWGPRIIPRTVSFSDARELSRLIDALRAHAFRFYMHPLIGRLYPGAPRGDFVAALRQLIALDQMPQHLKMQRRTLEKVVETAIQYGDALGLDLAVPLSDLRSEQVAKLIGTEIQVIPPAGHDEPRPLPIFRVGTVGTKKFLFPGPAVFQYLRVPVGKPVTSGIRTRRVQGHDDVPNRTNTELDLGCQVLIADPPVVLPTKPAKRRRETGPRRPYTCGKCGQEGHNRRRCAIET